MARKRKPQGLGDVVENITSATGIKAVVKAIAGEDCGCDERKKKLNDLFPFGKKIVNCATDEQKAYLEALFVKEPTQLAFSQQRELMAIYKHSYGINLEQSQCASCWRGYLNDLKRLI
jgi:hypothetical protein